MLSALFATLVALSPVPAPATSPTSPASPASRPHEDVEYLREFPTRARVRVVREVLVHDLIGLMRRQREQMLADERKPATRRVYHGVPTARYRVMFSDGPDKPERELLVRADVVIPGSGRETYHTWTAELAEGNVLILVYHSGGVDWVHAFDLEPPAKPGFEPRPLFPEQSLLVRWHDRFGTFLSAAVTGSLWHNDLTVTISRVPDAWRPDARRAAPGGAAASRPAVEVVRYRLNRAGDALTWTPVTDAPGPP